MIPGLDSDQCPRSEAEYMDGGIGPMVLGWTLTQPLERLWYLDGTLE